MTKTIRKTIRRTSKPSSFGRSRSMKDLQKIAAQMAKGKLPSGIRFK